MTMKYLFALFPALLFLSGVNMLFSADESPYGPLSDAEKRVIEQSGTDPKGEGVLTDYFEFGVYTCRKCGTPLYRSDDKFHSGCGWPAFDDEIPGTVTRSPDPDGKRIEITCSYCKGHLGHVFEGEKLTDKNVRHCVNTTSIVFEPQVGGRLSRACFAGGCFWGVEELMRRQKGVLAAVSGYTGGKVDNPTYQQVCTGKTGHAEAVEVIYLTAETDYETLCKYFLEIHDPTQKNRQGPDIGTQYRSEIFSLDDTQKKTAKSLLDILRKKGFDIQTKVTAYKKFWNAEEKHQDYYEHKGTAPYCHAYQKRF